MGADMVMDAGDDSAAADQLDTQSPLPAAQKLTVSDKPPDSTSSCTTATPHISDLLAAAFAANPQHNV